MTSDMAETILMIPVQETGDVGLSVEESNSGESKDFTGATKPSSVDPMNYGPSTDSGAVPNVIPYVEKVSKETQTDIVPYESDPEPAVKLSELEGINPPMPSDINDQQKSPPGVERRDEGKRRRKRKKRPMKERREVVPPPSNYPKTQHHSPSLLFSVMTPGIYSKFIMIVCFIVLFGLSPAASSTTMAGQWKLYSFAADSSLCNVQLTLKYGEFFCDLPISNCSQSETICKDKESKLVWNNNTFLYLVTRNQSKYILEIGHMSSLNSHHEGSFNEYNDALEYINHKREDSQNLGNSTMEEEQSQGLGQEPGLRSRLGIGVSLVALLISVIVGTILCKKCKEHGKLLALSNFILPKAFVQK
ncbi:uncharacterized protein LOC142107712 [Mixophyes fleayi]|uniref:uncharacterized protein LOC142107712 n=1 Tax=Mixophyes fleayi TaxID=3061075 RepID=UPI003F4D79B8